MRMLHRGRNRFEGDLHTLQGVGFRGTIQPISESSVSVDSFAEPRKLLRVRVNEPVSVGDVIIDRFDQHYVVGSHDNHVMGNAVIDRVHKLFQVNELLSWQRQVTTVEPISGLQRTTGLQELGPIWVAREIYGRAEMDRGLRISEERFRVITAAPVQLGDTLDGAVVKRLVPIFGIFLLETQ